MCMPQLMQTRRDEKCNVPPIIVGGLSALALSGLSHYLSLGGMPRIHLYAQERLSVSCPEKAMLELLMDLPDTVTFEHAKERQNYPWFGKLDVANYVLGSGKRVVAKGGKLNAEDSITVPSHRALQP